MKTIVWILIAAALLCFACRPNDKAPTAATFAEDVSFLQQHTDVLVLQAPNQKARVAVSPAYQGRVMTSTTGGDDGPSFGWINYELIASGENNPHINAFGGEDRFWLGPEGGQYSIFFKAGDPFDLEHWFTPPPINEEPFTVTEQSQSHIQFEKEMHLVNYSETVFELKTERTVSVLNETQSAEHLGITPQEVEQVAFQSKNSITNISNDSWQPETGLLSIWILGMFNPSPATTIVIPFKQGPEAERGAVVNDEYFGKVPQERLVIKDGVIFFKGDGQYRSKIGLSFLRAKPVMGSYDALNKVLTIVQYTLPENAVHYVNSMWELQDHPYKGDVVNSYNDGPPEPGAKPLGPFYELESSSPAAQLDPGESLEHTHRTFHFVGEEKQLDNIAKSLLGVGLEEIKNAFVKEQ
jgi:hypothetical protein